MFTWKLRIFFVTIHTSTLFISFCQKFCYILLFCFIFLFLILASSCCKKLFHVVIDCFPSVVFFASDPILLLSAFFFPFKVAFVSVSALSYSFLSPKMLHGELSWLIMLKFFVPSTDCVHLHHPNIYHITSHTFSLSRYGKVWYKCSWIVRNSRGTFGLHQSEQKSTMSDVSTTLGENWGSEVLSLAVFGKSRDKSKREKQRRQGRSKDRSTLSSSYLITLCQSTFVLVAPSHTTASPSSNTKLWQVIILNHFYVVRSATMS